MAQKTKLTLVSIWYRGQRISRLVKVPRNKKVKINLNQVFPEFHHIPKGTTYIIGG